MTMEKMALGGIHDQVGGGFHRYSTDRHWLVPHFEKMLYDNAMLLAIYDYAAKVSGRQQFRDVAEGIVGWLSREMTAPDGTFYSALDADSDGKEGKFYVWTWEELMALPDGEEFAKAYGCRPEGNFRDEATGRTTGLNILHEKEFQGDRFRHQLQHLLGMRSLRVRPGLDDKVLVGWNGLMIAGLSYAGKTEMAERAARATLDAERSYGRLPRMIVKGQPSGEAYLEDYAYFIYGLSRLRGPEYASAAQRLCLEMVDKFGDDEAGGFFSTSSNHDSLFGRTKMYFDQPLPSPNAIALLVIGGWIPWQKAGRHYQAAEPWILRAPHGTEALLATRVRVGHIAMASPNILSFDGIHGLLRIDIADGYHINSNPAADDRLIPTSIEFEGVTGSVSYPPGQDGLYVGRVEISFELEAPLSKVAKIKLRLQMCSENACGTPEERDLAPAFRKFLETGR
jgi:hypothetical protein